MGIRFQCPNGHALHVKSFLAGKRGICPQCGARVLIPRESTSDEPTVTDRQVADRQVADLSGGDQNPSFPPAASPSPDASTPGPPTGEGGLKPAEIATNGLPCEQVPGGPWYVHTDQGEQFGPVPAEVMTQWLADGRVTPQAWVWREGWPDWVAAASVFPAPSSPRVSRPGSEPLGPPAAMVGVPAIQADAPSTPAALRMRRKRGRRLAVLSVTMLSIACFVLALMLYYLLVYR